MRIHTNPDVRIASGFVLRSDASLRRMSNAISPAFSIEKTPPPGREKTGGGQHKGGNMQKKQHVSTIKRGSSEKYSFFAYFECNFYFKNGSKTLFPEIRDTVNIYKNHWRENGERIPLFSFLRLCSYFFRKICSNKHHIFCFF